MKHTTLGLGLRVGIGQTMCSVQDVQVRTYGLGVARFCSIFIYKVVTSLNKFRKSPKCLVSNRGCYEQRAFFNVSYTIINREPLILSTVCEALVKLNCASFE